MEEFQQKTVTQPAEETLEEIIARTKEKVKAFQLLHGLTRKKNLHGEDLSEQIAPGLPKKSFVDQSQQKESDEPFRGIEG